MKSLATIVAFSTMVFACAVPDDDKSDRTSTPLPDAVASDPVIAPSGGSVRAPYQIKTSAEMASTLAACVGPGMTVVDATMIQTAKNPAGFLPSRQFAVGDDVVVREAYTLDGDPSVARVGVR